MEADKFVQTVQIDCRTAEPIPTNDFKKPKVPTFTQANVQTDNDDPGIVLLGGISEFRMNMADYSKMITQAKTGSAFALKLLRRFMASDELKDYSWRGIETNGVTIKKNLSETQIMKAILEQVKRQYPDFNICSSFKKSISSLCSDKRLQ